MGYTNRRIEIDIRSDNWAYLHICDGGYVTFGVGAFVVGGGVEGIVDGTLEDTTVEFVALVGGSEVVGCVEDVGHRLPLCWPWLTAMKIQQWSDPINNLSSIKFGKSNLTAK